jgi:hypothetical protein
MYLQARLITSLAGIATPATATTTHQPPSADGLTRLKCTTLSFPPDQILTSLTNRLIKICAKPDIASFSKELMSLFESEVNNLKLFLEIKEIIDLNF